jgi:hypothetical protein
LAPSPPEGGWPGQRLLWPTNGTMWQ